MSSPLLIVAFIVLGLLALGAVVLPLLRVSRATLSEAGFDRAVYRDQLNEVERDVARGVLAPDEAASARLEIERRLLATADSGTAIAVRPARRRALLAGAVAIVVAVWAGGLYLVLGRPDAPDMPFASRAAAPEAPGMPEDVEGAADRLEAKLMADGGDMQGWMLLARTETALRHWDKAALAYRHLLPLMPAEAQPELNEAYGEMLVLAADGVVPPDAGKAFAITLAHDPSSPVSRYYTALADAQAGNAKQAIEAWLKLAGELPEDSDMRDAIAKRITKSATHLGIAPPPLPPPATSAKP